MSWATFTAPPTIRFNWGPRNVDRLVRGRPYPNNVPDAIDVLEAHVGIRPSFAEWNGETNVVLGITFDGDERGWWRGSIALGHIDAPNGMAIAEKIAKPRTKGRRGRRKAAGATSAAANGKDRG